STAALAFDNPNDARETLAALKAERHVVTAALYTRAGKLFASYSTAAANAPPVATPPADGYRFEDGYLIGVQPVVQGDHRMGSLYIKSDLEALKDRLESFGLIAALVLGVSCAVAYLLATSLQRRISRPI